MSANWDMNSHIPTEFAACLFDLIMDKGGAHGLKLAGLSPDELAPHGKSLSPLEP